MSEPNAVPNTAPKSNGAPQTVPMFSIQANSTRELMLKVAQTLLKARLFEFRETTGGKDGKGQKSWYAIWNQDDSGKIGAYNDGITLGAEEAKLLPTEKGCPIVFSSSFVLRQLTPAAALPARIAERQAATATREANRVTGASTSALLEELNRRRASGEQI